MSAVPREPRTGLVALLLAASAWQPCLSRADSIPGRPTTDEWNRRAALGDRLPNARVLWVNEGTIYCSTIASFSPTRVSVSAIPDQDPRWSPDGRRVVFAREPGGVWIMDRTGSSACEFDAPVEVIRLASTPNWTPDGAAVTAVASDGYRALKYELTQAPDTTSTIYDSTKSPYNGQQISQAAALSADGRFLLTFRVTPGHASEIVDLQRQTYLSNDDMSQGDCNPAWSPDGTYVITTSRLGLRRPVLSAQFDSSGPSLGPSQYFVGLSPSLCGNCDDSYIHGERVSNDGQWVVFGGMIVGGTQAAGSREIYLWKIGEPDDAAVRLTFDTFEDHAPSLFVEPTVPVTDAGVPEPDAGTPLPDAGIPEPDAGLPGPDAGRLDAGPAATDSGAGDGGEPGAAGSLVASATGCGCSSGAPVGLLPLALPAAAWGQGRRRGSARRR